MSRVWKLPKRGKEGGNPGPEFQKWQKWGKWGMACPFGRGRAHSLYNKISKLVTMYTICYLSYPDDKGEECQMRQTARGECDVVRWVLRRRRVGIRSACSERAHQRCVRAEAGEPHVVVVESRWSSVGGALERGRATHVGRAMGWRPPELGGVPAQEAGKLHVIVVVVERRWSSVGGALEQGAGKFHVKRAMGWRPPELGGVLAQEAGELRAVVVVVERRWSGAHPSRVSDVLEQGAGQLMSNA